MQTPLIEYSDNSFNALENNLKILGEDCSVDLVHNLRLNIKKIRALMTALDYKGYYLNDTSILKKIDSLFIQLGYLRDAHVQLSLLELYRKRVGEEVNDIIDHINKGKKKINKNINKRIRKINLFDIVLLNQRLDEVIECVDNSTIEGRFQQKAEQLFDQIIQSIRNSKDEKVLHRIRILLKSLIYTLSAIKKAKMNTKFNPSFTIFISTLQQKLGRWHDLSVFMDLISKFDSCNEQTNKLLQVVKHDKKLLHLEIIEDLRALRTFDYKRKGE